MLGGIACMYDGATFKDRAAFAEHFLECGQRQIERVIPMMQDALGALRSAESMLSLLRYRCERTIPWGTPGIPALADADEVIARARKALT